MVYYLVVKEAEFLGDNRSVETCSGGKPLAQLVGLALQLFKTISGEVVAVQLYLFATHLKM